MYDHLYLSIRGVVLDELTTTKLATSPTPASTTCPPTIGSITPRPTSTRRPTTTRAPTTTPTTTTTVLPPTTTPKQKPSYTAIPILSVTADKDVTSLVCQFSGSIEASVRLNVSIVVNGNIVLSKEVTGDSGSARFSVARINMYLYLARVSCQLFRQSVESNIYCILTVICFKAFTINVQHHKTCRSYLLFVSTTQYNVFYTLNVNVVECLWLIRGVYEMIGLFNCSILVHQHTPFLRIEGRFTDVLYKLYVPLFGIQYTEMMS